MTPRRERQFGAATMIAHWRLPDNSLVRDRVELAQRLIISLTTTCATPMRTPVSEIATRAIAIP
jgi:hypothetical protein